MSIFKKKTLKKAHTLALEITFFKPILRKM